MFEKEIAKYEQLRKEYLQDIVLPMEKSEYLKYSEILFSSHSCAIEGNSFSVNDTRELKEKGLGMIPAGKSLLEAFEILDHFNAFEYVIDHLQHPFDENLLKEVNRLVTIHTLSYRAENAVPGEYTTTDMAAGDTIFGDHEKLIKQIPSLMSATEKAMKAKNVHPLILSARFHGYCEYLHPFRDGNGRTGRLLSNFILLQQNHPLLIIKIEDKDAYLESLRQIRKEGTDEHLIRFFFKTAMQRMESELNQKLENSRPHSSFY